MKLYVGITDWSWYDYLRDHHYDEVNFWKPSGGAFKAINEGDLFLFKMKAAHGEKIAGGGFFTRYLTMTVDWAWRAFGDENGVNNLAELSDAIERYRTKKGLPEENPRIGCIILNDVFYFDERDWFDAPGKWNGVVTGKSRSLDDPEGKWLYDQTMLRLKALELSQTPASKPASGLADATPRYAMGMSKHRRAKAPSVRSWPMPTTTAAP